LVGQALQAGDLAGAQQAFAAMIQSVPGGGTPTSPPAGGAVGNDITTLGQALQSGNPAGAQQAFATLQQAVQSVGQAHGAARGQHHSGAGADSGAAGATSSASATTITNQITTTNADGTITVTITYADGTTATTTQPNPTPTVATNPLDPRNLAQQRTLLTLQEQAAPGQSSRTPA
jgi:hypothetical protein